MFFRAISGMDIQNQPRKGAKLKKETHSVAHKIVLGTWLLLAAAGLACYFLMRLRFFGLLGVARIWLLKGSLAATISFLILFISKWAEGIVTRHKHHKAERYNLIRLIRLLAALVIVGIFVTILFENWYSAVVSLGLISLILGFALQTPISSFIGWLYIILRNPYRVGDRIQINEFRGDVVEIGYLDTTVWEAGGDYLTSDLPTGRLIRFPNSLVLNGAVYNYSWRKFPYIWNELPFHIAYESDFDFVSTTLKGVAKEVLGENMAEDVERLKSLISQTAIDDVQIREYPFVTFRTNANTWVEATLVYLVHPRKATATRTALLTKGVTALLKEPDRVLFPKGNNR